MAEAAGRRNRRLFIEVSLITSGAWRQARASFVHHEGYDRPPMIPDTPRGTWVTTDVPGRLDALGWARWHQRLIAALGITWILDGLEASLVANIAPTLQHPDTLGLSATQIGMANSVYLLGQAVGALLLG